MTLTGLSWTVWGVFGIVRSGERVEIERFVGFSQGKDQ